MDENIKLQPEEEGKEFGYFPFKELPPVTTKTTEEVIACKIGNINIHHTDPVEIKIDTNSYTMVNNILRRKLVENRLLYTPIVVPDILKDCLLILAHDKQGHNGFRKTYASLKKQISLEGHEEISPQTLHEMPSLCKTQHQNTATKKRTFFITTPTNGIHSNGLDRRIPPSI